MEHPIPDDTCQILERQKMRLESNSNPTDSNQPHSGIAALQHLLRPPGSSGQATVCVAITVGFQPTSSGVEAEQAARTANL